MPSTTAAKKEIIDYLWEWADPHGDWSKLLVNFVVTTEKALTEEDRQIVFEYFLDSMRSAKNKKMSPIRLSKPVYRPVSKEIKLATLKGITGVNRLAKDQVLDFSKNLTVVYGENGTGKTGYGRILKTLGFSYDPKNVIHQNIYGKKEAKSATIDFTCDGSPDCFLWDGQNTNDDLSNISVFNNNCVQISLTDRQLIVSPIGFHLFGLVSTELMALGKMLQEKISLHSTEILWLSGLHEDTPQYQLMATLDSDCTEEQVKALAKCSDDITELLIAKQKALANLNQDLMNTQLANLTAQVKELTDMQNNIRLAQSLLSADRVKELTDLNKSILALDSRTQTGLKGIAENNNIPMYESTSFKDFITAADDYLKQLERLGYPEEGDRCLYCRQPLDESGRDLLANYKRLLNDTTQRERQRLVGQRGALIASAKPVNARLVFHQPVYGIGEDQAPAQPPALMQYNDRLSQLKENFEQNRVTEEIVVDVDYAGLMDLLHKKQVQIQAETEKLNGSLRSITQAATTLTSAIHELKDRIFLRQHLEDAIKILQNHKIVTVLKSKMSELSTGPLSRKTSDARELLVQRDFDAIFQQELKALRKSDLPVSLSFGTERGNSKLTQRVKSYLLTDVLSEGEQKAIALAEFLTELQLDIIRAPVIFDDPVNSLDHHITDEVAKRLIRLSKTRQTIIFTHSILLLNSLRQQAELPTNKQESINCVFYSLKNNLGETGILCIGDEVNSFNFFIKKVQAIVNGPKAGGDEAELAAKGYGHLRAAIEVAVEEDLFQRTIVRYRKGVAFPSLLRVEGVKIDQYKGTLNDIYEKCCVSIDGHSSPIEIHTSPRIADLKADLAGFLEVRGHFRTK